MRVGTLYLACLPLIVLPTATYGQVTARDTLPVVRRLEIVGNEAFSDDEIRRAIATRASGCKSVFLGPLCLIHIGAFRRTERLDPRELRTDVARIRVFYARRGYRAAHVDTAVVRDDGHVDVSFEIEEGTPTLVRTLDVRGLEGIRDSHDVIADLALREGEPFSEIAILDSEDHIRRELGVRGYPRAAVLVSHSIPREDSLNARVVLEVEPGPQMRIGAIEVRGIAEIDTADVMRLLNFRSGEVYNADDIVSSQRELYSMALFEYVDIKVPPPADDSLVDVVVQVSEAPMRGVELGFGLSTAECLQVQAQWTHRNFFRGTRTLQLHGELSNIGTSQLAERFPCRLAGVRSDDPLASDPFNRVNWRLRADFQQPWFLGRENKLRLGVFSERQSLPNIYARTSLGGDVSFSRELSVGSAVEGTYRSQFDRLDEGSTGFFFCANFGICQPGDINEVAGTRLLSPISVGFSWARTDAVFSPRSGYRLVLEAEHASRFTHSDWAYYRTMGEFRWYRALSDVSVFAFRLRGGAVRPIGAGIEGTDLGSEPVTHPQKRLYAGGANTVRGFGQNLLGPKVLLADSRDLGACDPRDVTENNTWICNPSEAGLTATQVDPRPIGGQNSVLANLELRMTLADRWATVLFVDLGHVWTESGQANLRTRLAWSPGIGLRYRSPVGPLRVDLGYNTGGIEQLPVVSELRREGVSTIVQLGRVNDSPFLFDYDPFRESGLSEVLSRLQLHLSIGQAF